MIGAWHPPQDRFRNQNLVRELGSFRLQSWKNFYLNEEKSIKENQTNDSLLFLMAHSDEKSTIRFLPKELVFVILSFKTASDNRHLNIAKDIFNRSLKFYKKNPQLTPNVDETRPLISEVTRIFNKVIEERKQEEIEQQESCCFCQIL